MLPQYVGKDLKIALDGAAGLLTAPSVAEYDLCNTSTDVFHGLEHAMLKTSRQFKRYCVCEAVRTLLRLSAGDTVGATISVASALNHLTAALLIATAASRFSKIQITSGATRPLVFQVTAWHNTAGADVLAVQTFNLIGFRQRYASPAAWFEGHRCRLSRAQHHCCICCNCASCICCSTMECCHSDCSSAVCVNISHKNCHMASP